MIQNNTGTDETKIRRVHVIAYMHAWAIQKYTPCMGTSGT